MGKKKANIFIYVILGILTVVDHLFYIDDSLLCDKSKR